MSDSLFYCQTKFYVRIEFMCTSIQMKSSDGGLLFARTMDWHTFAPAPLTLARGYAWQTAYNHKSVKNLYAVLGIGRNFPDSHADISDGVNEFGLAAQKLTFSNHSEYSETANNFKLQLAPFEFVMWLLGNCRSVAEVIEKVNDVQLMTDEFSLMKYGRNDLHFAVTDSTGRMVSIEPRDKKLIVIENRIGVVTNAPSFEREIAKLEPYLDFTNSSNSLNGISTGNFSGKPVFPGGFTPTSRFIRATVLKERAITPENEHQNVIETWHILNAVTVPKSDGRSDTYTIYRSAVELKSKTLYFQRYEDFAITSYRFPDETIR